MRPCATAFCCLTTPSASCTRRRPATSFRTLPHRRPRPSPPPAGSSPRSRCRTRPLPPRASTPPASFHPDAHSRSRRSAESWRRQRRRRIPTSKSRSGCPRRGTARSYFTGCSTGGQQALSEAQRYPADYDGIVAGDPGNNRINLIYGFLWSWLATHDADGTSILSRAKLPALAQAAVAACDKNDGLEDGLIGDPRTCRFDPSVLACRGDETDACLTPRQIDAATKVYAGAKTKSGQQLYPGWAP